MPTSKRKMVSETRPQACWKARWKSGRLLVARSSPAILELLLLTILLGIHLDPSGTSSHTPLQARTKSLGIILGTGHSPYRRSLFINLEGLLIGCALQEGDRLLEKGHISVESTLALRAREKFHAGLADERATGREGTLMGVGSPEGVAAADAVDLSRWVGGGLENGFSGNLTDVGWARVHPDGTTSGKAGRRRGAGASTEVGSRRTPSLHVITLGGSGRSLGRALMLGRDAAGNGSGAHVAVVVANLLDRSENLFLARSAVPGTDLLGSSENLLLGGSIVSGLVIEANTLDRRDGLRSLNRDLDELLVLRIRSMGLVDGKVGSAVSGKSGQVISLSLRKRHAVNDRLGLDNDRRRGPVSQRSGGTGRGSRTSHSRALGSSHNRDLQGGKVGGVALLLALSARKLDRLRLRGVPRKGHSMSLTCRLQTAVLLGIPQSGANLFRHLPPLLFLFLPTLVGGGIADVRRLVPRTVVAECAVDHVDVWLLACEFAVEDELLDAEKIDKDGCLGRRREVGGIEVLCSSVGEK
jgi:hypothetical protein